MWCGVVPSSGGLWTLNRFYFKSRSTNPIIPWNSMDVKKQIENYQRILQTIFLYVGCFCFWICVGIIESKNDCRKSGFNVCTSNHLLLRNVIKRRINVFLFIGFCLFLFFFLLCLQDQHFRVDWSSRMNAFSLIDRLDYVSWDKLISSCGVSPPSATPSVHDSIVRTRWNKKM